MDRYVCDRTECLNGVWYGVEADIAIDLCHVGQLFDDNVLQSRAEGRVKITDDEIAAETSTGFKDLRQLKRLKVMLCWRLDDSMRYCSKKKKVK